MERRAALRMAARHLRDEVRAGRLSDLEALARLAEARAAPIERADWQERWRYIADLVSTLTEWEIGRLPPRRRADHVAFGQSGFAPRYWSDDPNSRNQVRHLMAYVPLGFWLPAPLAAPLPWLGEALPALWRRRPIDGPDVALSRRGVELGHAIRRGSVAPAAVGDWLRLTLGEAGPGTV